VPGPILAQIEPHRKRLLHPLHDRRKLHPVGGLDVERQSFLIKPKSPKLEDEALPRLAEYPAEDRYRLPLPEQRGTAVDHRPDLIPDIIHQKSLLSHIYIYGSDSPFCFNRTEKK
jgi:hypothetical protein